MSETASNPLNNALSGIKNMKEDFVSYMILGFILLLVILMIVYIMYLTKLPSKECSYMNDIYGTLNGNIRSINESDPDCGYNLNEYMLKPHIILVQAGRIKMMLLTYVT